MRHTRKTLLILAVIVAAITSGCSKGDDENPAIILKTAEKTLSFGDTYQIEATSPSPITYTAENDYYAAVSSSGLVTARFVGETNITLTNDKDSKKVTIIVSPKSTLYPTPNVEFGISRSALIAKLGKPAKETSSGIAYSNYSNVAELVMYVFDANDKLTNTGVAVKTAYSSELGAFLSERYLLINKENLLFVNSLDPKKEAMLIRASLYNTSYWLVSYGPYTPKSNASAIRCCIKNGMFDELVK
jgi:hypothetical protein